MKKMLTLIGKLRLSTTPTVKFIHYYRLERITTKPPNTLCKQ